jgi:hypothetical protein
MNEIAKQPDTDDAAMSIPERVLSLAAQPGVNPEMFDRLVAWQQQEAASQAEERFNDAMNKVQAEILPVVRTAENKQTNSFYAKLEAVDAAIRPIYLRYGFNVSYGTVEPLTAGNIRVVCEVALGRHKKLYYREAPADTMGPKGAPTKTVLHGGGSTETYLKRYAVCGAFNVVFSNMGDDDGNRGGMQFVSAQQAHEIRALLEQAGRAEDSFLYRLCTDVRSADEVESKDFVRVKGALMEIIASRAARAP